MKEGVIMTNRELIETLSKLPQDAEIDIFTITKANKHISFDIGLIEGNEGLIHIGILEVEEE